MIPALDRTSRALDLTVSDYIDCLSLPIRYKSWGAISSSTPGRYGDRDRVVRWLDVS